MFLDLLASDFGRTTHLSAYWVNEHSRDIQNLAQQCRLWHASGGIEQHFGEGCSTKRPATRKGFGRFRFRWAIAK
jgi:hypothetical protein